VDGEPEAILTLGDTFDLELTGRENAISAAIVAGFRRKEALARLDEIVEFAELESAIDQPLRTFSDGMRLRLAFAVAASVEPRVLVIDEVVSVGDTRFQQKCIKRLHEFQSRGATILLASHDEQLVRQLCTRAVCLAHGRVETDGSPDDAYDAYGSVMRAETEMLLEAAAGEAPTTETSDRMRKRVGTFDIEIVGCDLASGLVTDGSAGNVHLDVAVKLRPRVSVVEPIVRICVRRADDGVKVIDANTDTDKAAIGYVDRERTVRLHLESVRLAPGSYRVDAGVYARDWSHIYDFQSPACEFDVPGVGLAPESRRWSVH